MTTEIRGILFDLGETLINFGPINPREYFKAGTRLAHQYLCDLGKAPPRFSTYHRRLLLSVQWHTIKSGVTRREFDAAVTLAALHAKLGMNLTGDEIAEMAWRLYKPLNECSRPDPQCVETLSRLSDMGLKLGMVSNTFLSGALLDRHLDEEGMLKLLPVRVYSCDVRYRKPHLRIFRIALERSGLEAGETFFVGDLPRADIRGANRAGLISVLKDPTGKHDNCRDKPRHRIQAVAQLPELLRGYDLPAAGRLHTGESVTVAESQEKSP